jgi:hypothetical protein
MSTSKTDLYLHIPRRTAKEKTSKTIIPPRPPNHLKETKQNQKKKSKTKTTREKNPEKEETGKRQSDEGELHSHRKHMPNQSRQCVILTKKSAECAENSSGRRHEGPAAVSNSPPFAFLEVPAPPKKMNKRKILLPHLL